MEKNKFIAIVLAFMLPLLSCYSQSNNKRGDKTLSNQQDTSKKDEANKANSAAVSSFIGKLMSNQQDTSKKVEGNHANTAALEKNIARNNADSKGKAYLSCPDNNHPHMIDLGLPSGTKWACCNVDASSPKDNGGYYAWGEIKEKRTYNWKTYIHFDCSNETFHNLGKDIAGTKYDVAHVKWGGGWHMPTQSQILELLNNTTSKWTSEYGVRGIMITGSNGGTIFLRAAGYYCYWEHLSAGSYGRYWSSTLYEGDKNTACDLYFKNGSVGWGYSDRYYGRPVRPVAP